MTQVSYWCEKNVERRISMLVTSCVLVISYLQARTNKPKFKTITEVSLKGFLQREHKLEYKQFHFVLFHSENFNWRMQLILLIFYFLLEKNNFGGPIKFAIYERSQCPIILLSCADQLETSVVPDETSSCTKCTIALICLNVLGMPGWWWRFESLGELSTNCKFWFPWRVLYLLI